MNMSMCIRRYSQDTILFNVNFFHKEYLINDDLIIATTSMCTNPLVKLLKSIGTFCLIFCKVNKNIS